jgi:hypothetical protein
MASFFWHNSKAAGIPFGGSLQYQFQHQNNETKPENNNRNRFIIGKMQLQQYIHPFNFNKSI